MNIPGRLENHQCRTCYSSTKGLKLLKSLTKCSSGSQEQRSLAELLIEVTNINVMDDFYKKLPQFICDNCSRKLKAAHAFIHQTHEVHEKLMAILMGQGDTNKQLDCLKEAQVDISSCMEIKIEDNRWDTKCQIELKAKEEKVSLERNYLDMEEEIDDKQSSNSKLDPKTSKLQLKIKEDEKDIFHKASKIEQNQPIQIFDQHKIELRKDKNSDTNDDTDSEKNYEEESHSDDTDWQEDRKLHNRKSKKYDIRSKKPTRSLDNISKPNEDEDVAVPCSQCNKIFPNAKALDRHQRNSHVRKCTCPVCFRKFTQSCSMYTHMRTFHGPESVLPFLPKPLTEERNFQCDICPKKYTKQKYLNVHIKIKHDQKNDKSSENKPRTTSGERPVKEINKPLCSICGLSFPNKTHLDVHMRRHTGERPFKCDLCEKAFPRLVELKNHRRIHTGEKPFECKTCGKSFRVSSKLNSHMRSHTDLRPYRCTECERTFKYSKDLNIHFRTHTGERPYRCNICDSTFVQSNSLKAHRAKLGHMEDVVEQTKKLEN